MEPTKQQIYNAYKKLPEQVRKYIVSVQGAEDIATLGKNKSLTAEQTSKLAKQSGFYLMKIVPEDALAGNIEYELNIETQVAETLASYIKDVIKSKSERYVEPLETVGEEEEQTSPEPKVEVAPRTVPINRIIAQEQAPAPISKPAPAPVEEVIHKLDDNLPAVLPEREVTIRKIVTENPILNRQLEVPVVMHEKKPEVQPTPVPIKRIVPETSTVTSLEDSRVSPPPKEELPTMNVPAKSDEGVLPSEGALASSQGGRSEPIPTQTPVEPRITSATIIDAKLHGSFGMPKTEVDITPENEKPKPKFDPYREPAV